MAALASATASYVRASAFRSKVLNLTKTCSIGLRSGEYLGRNTRRAPNVPQHDSGLSPIRRDHHDRRLLAGAEIRPIVSETGEEDRDERHDEAFAAATAAH